MGNFVPACVSIIAPFATSEILIPFVYYPFRFSDAEFVKPTTFKYMIWYIFFVLLLIDLASICSGIMTTLKECKKVEIWTTIKGSYMPTLFAFFGLVILFLFPFIKAPLLAIFALLPYSDHFVTGLLLSIFTMVGGFFGNNYIRSTVCS